MYNQQQDWIMKQIKTIANTIAALVFRKAEVSYEIQDEANQTETDMLFLHLNKMLDDGNINGAEDMLFDELDPSNTAYLLLAVDFYQRLNAIPDEELERCGYSRDEIIEGLCEVAGMYGMKF